MRQKFTTIFNPDDKCVYIVGGHTHWTLPPVEEEKKEEPVTDAPAEEKKEEEKPDKVEEDEEGSEQEDEDAEDKKVSKRKRYEPRNLNLVDKYDTVNNKWISVSPLNSARSQAGLFFTPDGFLYAF